MAISEDLQRRINTLTQGSLNPPPRRLGEEEIMEMRKTNPMAGMLGSPEGMFTDDVNIQTQMPVNENPAADAISFVQQSLQNSTDPEEREGLMSMIEKLQAQAMAPMGQIAQELAQMGGGEDTALAHVRPGEVVVPPEIVEDPEVESLLESKFKQMNINPEEAVVGLGIASLNPNTGLEQFGFFKKIKKVFKKVAPIAVNFIPGVGPVAKAALTAGVGKASGLSTKDALLAGGLSFAGSKMLGGPTPTGGSTATGNIFQRAKEYILPGQDKVGLFGNIRKGIGSFFGGPGSDTVGTLDGQPITAADYKNLTTEEIMRIQPVAPTARGSIFGGTPGQSRIGVIEDFIKGRPSDPVRQGGIFSGTTPGTSGGGFGGLGDLAKIGGIGALAAGLGKLAYDEAKDQRGVPLTPLTTMDATGRYNIEAEIARRMGQQAPNPVEFGLLPEGTLPELSGGKPRGMQEGGSVETDVVRGAPTELIPNIAANVLQNLREQSGALLTESEIRMEIARQLRPYTGNMVSEREIEEVRQAMFPTKNMMYGGPVMAYAEGGNVAMEDFKRMNGRIDGPGTETSDDIPAMLSDGEFVMTGQAVRGAGSFDMRNQGGIVTLTPNGSPDRENGTELMYQLMEVFSGQARPSA